jgi:hypothetical protein
MSDITIDVFNKIKVVKSDIIGQVLKAALQKEPIPEDYKRVTIIQIEGNIYSELILVDSRMIGFIETKFNFGKTLTQFTPMESKYLHEVFIGKKHIGLLKQRQNTQTRQDLPIRKSCNRACSASDFYKGGRCDINGCC